METAKHFWLVCLLILLSGGQAQAQSEPVRQELQIRLGASAKAEVIENVDVSLEPEMRTDGWNPDRYLIEGGVRYKPIKYFATKATLRGDLEETKIGLVHSYRPAAAVAGYLPFLDDFKAEARLQYMYAFGPYRDPTHTLRYKAGLEYNVPKVKLDLSVSVETFHRVFEGEFNRMRYAIEAKYEFYSSKKFDQGIALGYMLDYLLQKPINRHIPTIQYFASF